MFAGAFQFYRNYNSVWRKIKFTYSVVFLLAILFILLIFLVTMGDSSSSLKSLLIFPLLGVWFILIESYAYNSARKTSDIYRVESIDLAQDGFIFFYNNFLRQGKILFNDILKLSFAGYNPSNIFVKTKIWYMHYVVGYKDAEGKIRELPIPLDISGLPEFLKIIIEKAGLIKVKTGQFNLLYEWRKPFAGENLAVIENNDLNPCVIDPNKNL